MDAVASVVLPCADLGAEIAFLVERLGFRLERISPADDPRAAELFGHGLRVVLRRGDGPPGTLRVASADPRPLADGAVELRSPNGTRVELVEARPALAIPAGRRELVVQRAGEAPWIVGRAGMRYRDLIPGRLGGRFVASHIRIDEGGPVPDHVHFHAVRFQMIHCARGWVRLVYEDQGPPFVMAAGDGVLQPPRLRHRVLESSPGLEVIEVACPAEHDTFLDHELELPTSGARPERERDGQRFVRYRAEGATWAAWELPGFECRDTGIAAATAGLAGARVVRRTGEPLGARPLRDAGELLFLHVLSGELSLAGAAPEPLGLAAGDSVALPAGLEVAPASASGDLELLEVRLPA